MSCALDSDRPPVSIYRVGRDSPWNWPDWTTVGDDGTFGNRWDDPQGSYRVLYASSSRRGCFLETLARFRPDPAVIAGLAAVVGEEPLDAVGVVPRSWLGRRSVGTASVAGDFANVGKARSLGWLRRRFSVDVVEFGLADLDAAAIRLVAPRRLTQRMSRTIYECSDGDRRQFSGIAYLSRFGDEIQNWAIFEPGEINVTDAIDVRPSDADLISALSILGLTLDSV